MATYWERFCSLLRSAVRTGAEERQERQSLEASTPPATSKPRKKRVSRKGGLRRATVRKSYVGKKPSAKPVQTIGGN